MFQINELDPHVVSYGLVSLATGVILRILCTIAISFGDKLNWKERVSWVLRAISKLY